MDTFSFNLVLNVDHCIIWSWTMPTMVTSVLEYLKIIPKCKKKNMTAVHVSFRKQLCIIFLS